MAFSFGVESKAPEYKITKHLRLIELFAGVGTQAMALRDIGADFERYRVIEFDESAIKSYNAIHGTSFEATDIRNVKSEDLGIVDKDKYEYLMTYSFPCFTKDTLILTKDGLKCINEVKEGDYVLTHTNTYKKVVASRKTGHKEVFNIKALGVHELKCTENHKFYVRQMSRTYSTLENGKRGSVRKFDIPKWVECKSLTKNHYLGISVNQNSIIPSWDGITLKCADGKKDRCRNEISNLLENNNFWWTIGRYIGDGWVSTQGGIVICCARTEVSEIESHLIACGLSYSIVEERTVCKVHIPKKELSSFVEPFGRDALNKRIPGYMFDMPVTLLKSFIEGYLSADGYVQGNKCRIASISKQLIYGTAQLIAKVYKQPYKIYKCNRKKTVLIEGKLCNQHDSYEVCWKLESCKQDKAFYENGYIWVPIKSVTKVLDFEDVFDIEVENDHSFTANGIIAHNCTDLSLAGKRAGMSKDSGTRSGLLWEVERLLDESVDRAFKEGKDKSTYLPQVLLMENVSQVHNPKNIGDFNTWLDKLKSLGYTSVYKDLNARDFNTPQNRVRCFMVSMLGDYNYTFPTPPGLSKKIEDVLEQNVDRKFYVSEERRKQLIDDLKSRGYIK